MKIKAIHHFAIENAIQKQFHTVVLMKDGTIAGLFSENQKSFLQWFSENQSFITEISWAENKSFHKPTLFHFGNYVGIFTTENDSLILYHKDEKEKLVKVLIINKLPKIKHSNFDEELQSYHRAGNTDTNTIPFLFRNMGLLPVCVADLKIDLEKSEGLWLNIKFWNNSQQIDLEKESFELPKKKCVILDVLNKENNTYAFGIGDRDGGYLKYGMDISDLVTISESGRITNALFSLGRLYKESKKGGKECIFSSSGKYAILTPAFKSDDWKNKQELFDLEKKCLVDVELPKGFTSHRIIDHNDRYFLLVDGYNNLIFNAKQFTICSEN